MGAATKSRTLNFSFRNYPEFRVPRARPEDLPKIRLRTSTIGRGLISTLLACPVANDPNPTIALYPHAPLAIRGNASCENCGPCRCRYLVSFGLQY